MSTSSFKLKALAQIEAVFPGTLVFNRKTQRWLSAAKVLQQLAWRRK